MEFRHGITTKRNPFAPEWFTALLRQCDVVIMVRAVLGLRHLCGKVLLQIRSEVPFAVRAIAGSTRDLRPVDVGAIDPGFRLRSYPALHQTSEVRIVGAAPGFELVRRFLAVRGIAIVRKSAIRPNCDPRRRVFCRLGTQVVLVVVPLFAPELQHADLIFLRFVFVRCRTPVDRTREISEDDEAFIVKNAVVCLRLLHPAIELFATHVLEAGRAASERDGHIVRLQEFLVRFLSKAPMPPVSVGRPCSSLFLRERDHQHGNYKKCVSD